MSKRFNLWLLVLAAVLVSRLIGMAFFPFTDTTEPRYAEIARLMAETGDWITPWFEPGVPFWGKPPLSFWAQAIAIKIFGLSEFALRLPSWLVTIATTGLVWRLARQVWSMHTAKWSSLVFATMALTYISAGAVMTDSFLALGTTLALVSFCLVMSGEQGVWRWLFFIGVVIGLLSKGPLAVVLIGTPIVSWQILSRQKVISLRKLPWLSGGALTILLVGPWYVLAELKTPGFLDYFIVGEHIRRFLDPGWVGDLYGSAHEQPKGMIWVFWLWASFPWGCVALVGVVIGWIRGRGAEVIRETVSASGPCYLLMSAMSPMLFFTVAGNTLWTYVLPSLPFTAILIGRWVAKLESGWAFRVRGVMIGFVPVLLTVFVGAAATGWETLKTEKELVLYYQQTRKSDDSPLLYLDEIPFSARFYSQGAARSVTEEGVTDMQQQDEYRRLYVAVPRDWSGSQVAEFSRSASSVLKNRRYQLLEIQIFQENQLPVSDASGVRLNDS